eukprot:CAMPEP_0197832782 /NCGR_PEP_ID=MMETSP1437-20131217/16156_1 /TAXON_ID=49252 ORGANISM="Eucampia antarctica, Strain CCMP1452" /NCGR_SAMPLE_ID=MMETSP1437 /ASSEMBLY_ACC=CAM_ASM_001096 /LENGTH=225 /DNA_ID=CAMNT_0043436365 /DNA_START=84 /DNA_END=761 /DNA_ORIENTATION=+
MRTIGSIFLLFAFVNHVHGWTTQSMSSLITRGSISGSSARLSTAINIVKHGEDACFLPLKQLDQDYFAPRVFQVAGVYPGLTVDEYNAVNSEPPPEQGQWSYDFSDPNGPQLGTVAIEGNLVVGDVEDGAVIISDHFTLGVPLPETITDPVDLIVLVDRACKNYADRQFLVVESPTEGLKIEAYKTFSDMPKDTKVIGHVEYVTIPWLPAMKPTKTGFMEDDTSF